jgi:hypothetical protein
MQSFRGFVLFQGDYNSVIKSDKNLVKNEKVKIHNCPT